MLTREVREWLDKVKRKQYSYEDAMYEFARFSSYLTREEMIMIKRILGMIEYLVIAVVGGFLLITGVYALPKTRMVNNINRSKELLETEGSYRYWAADLLNTQSDNFTDSLMADTAINPG